MAAEKKWKGIQTNFCMFQGEIIADPVPNGGYMFLTLRTIAIQRGDNNQFIEAEQDIPLMVEPDGPVNVAKDYIKTGRKLLAWCHYKNWYSDGVLQHAFVVRKFDLGDKPYEGPATGNTPPLPTR